MINQDMQITGMYDYMPFGEQIPVSLSGTKDRLSFIGKENDIESGLGDFGVRKYDTEGGRFLSIDPLWEKYLAWSPYHYHYCQNNPINATDGNGMAEYFDNNMKSLGSDGNSEDTRNFITTEKDFLAAKDKGTWGDIQHNLIATQKTMELMKTLNSKTDELKQNELAIVEFRDGSNSGKIQGLGAAVDPIPAINDSLGKGKTPTMTIHWHLIATKPSTKGMELISQKGDCVVQQTLVNFMRENNHPQIYNGIMVNPNYNWISYYDTNGKTVKDIPFHKYVGFYDKK